MRLVRLRIGGFGSLRGEYVFDPDRASIVVDENERGKTSLLHAVVAALYGLDRDTRRYRSAITPVDRWRPWDGGDYGVELEIETDGERYIVSRDFERGTVQVWNDRGQDITPEFVVEKDEILVGQQLLGLDAEEFAKCAFWRQGELAEVVPDQEKERRVSTLQARLESAADTRAGDASAIEAIQTLDGALQRYTSAELGTTITVDNAIKRLEGLGLALESDIQSLEHDLRGIAEPLERLAGLDDDERSLRRGLHELDTWRRKLRADDAQRRLNRDADRRAEAGRARDEAQPLAAFAAVPADAPTWLATAIERHAAEARRIESLTEERAPVADDIARLGESLATLERAAGRTAADADALAVGAGALRRLGDDARRLESDRESALGTIRGHGFDPDAAAALIARFERVGPAHIELLIEQPRLAIARQVESTTAEQSRAVGRAALRDVATWRRGRYAVAACVVVAAMAVGALTLARLAIPPLALAGAAGVIALAGITLAIVTALARRDAVAAARERIAHADEQLRQAGLAATDNDTRLTALARELGYETPARLVEDWSAVQHLRELHAPIETVRLRLAELRADRDRVLRDMGDRATGLDGPSTDAAFAEHVETLERAAADIRKRLEIDARSRTASTRLARLDDQIATARRAADEAEQAAAAAVKAAGLAYAPGRPWPHWIAEVTDRSRRALRHRELTVLEIPALEREYLDDVTLETLRAEVAHAEAEAMGLDPGALEALAGLRTPAEAESRMAELRTQLDALAAERGRLRRIADATSDRYHAEHPVRCARLEIVEAEQARAHRFRDAVQLARDTVERVARETHRRWAEFLNDRVSELLSGLGSSIGRVRFGDDLDFAVTLGSGRLSARGRAVYQVSTGARDQLHLAVRLAISEYLSRGRESLPLLIDDCFATSDDERARSGMRLLLDRVSRTHQVIIVTCHRQRVDALAALDPALYDARAQWLELRPLAVV